MGLGFGMDFFAGLAEGKPTIPKLKPINAQDEQAKAIAGNTAALPGLTELAGRINTFNAGEIERMLEMSMPGYAKLRDKITGVNNQLLSGQIPEDVSMAVQRNSAVKSLYGGFSGSGMAKNLTARDLGLTSLDLTQKGLDSASRWIAMSRGTTPTFDVTSMFISPALQIQTSFAEREAQFQRDYVSNLNDWQHSVGYLFGQDMRNTGETIKQLMSSYLGGGMSSPSSAPASSSSGSWSNTGYSAVY